MLITGGMNISGSITASDLFPIAVADLQTPTQPVPLADLALYSWPYQLPLIQVVLRVLVYQLHPQLQDRQY